MSFSVRGVIEGFYGRLWTWPERRRVAEVAGEAGFTTYAHAPKEDRLQNGEWRTAYPPDAERELASFADHCRAQGLDPWFGLRPVGISYADDADLLRLVAKLRRALELGAERLVLLADDIPAQLDASTGGRFERLVDAHGWLIDQVLEQVPLAPERLVFVPTAYHGFDGGYLEPLGTALPPPVDVCWTGAEVFVPSLTVVEADRIAAVLGRPPLIWDNYPVNDEHDRHELRIGPIRGREAGLARATRGVLVNPALEPEATLVPLLTWGDFLTDPDAYDPEAAWHRALVRVTGSERDAATVATVAAALDRSVIDQGWTRPPAPVVAEAVVRLGTLANRALADELTRFVVTR